MLLLFGVHQAFGIIRAFLDLNFVEVIAEVGIPDDRDQRFRAIVIAVPG